MIFIGALIIGTSIGILTGMFGVGGGFLITPLLNIVLGVSMPIAVGTGVMQILGVSTAGLYRRRNEGQTDYKMAVVLFGGNFVGVRLGAATLGWLSSMGTLTLHGEQVPAVDFILLCVFIVVLAAIAGWVFYDTSRNKTEETGQVGLFSRIKLPPYTEFPTLDSPRLSVIVMSYFGLALGFLTGLLGIGGGVILVPAFIYLVGMRTHCASATSLAMIWLSSVVGTITHASYGNTDMTLAIPLLLGGAAGLQIGVGFCSRLDGIKLRRYFAFVVLAALLLVGAKIAAILT